VWLALLILPRQIAEARLSTIINAPLLKDKVGAIVECRKRAVDVEPPQGRWREKWSRRGERTAMTLSALFSVVDLLELEM